MLKKRRWCRCKTVNLGPARCQGMRNATFIKRLKNQVQIKRYYKITSVQESFDHSWSFNPCPWGGILHIPLTCGTILDPPEHHRAPPRESWRWPRWLYRWTASGANHSSFPRRSPHWRTPNWPGWLPFCSCWSPNLIFFPKIKKKWENQNAQHFKVCNRGRKFCPLTCCRSSQQDIWFFLFATDQESNPINESWK